MWHGGFSRHNLKVSTFAKYYMIDAWSYRQNDSSVDEELHVEHISTDKNEKSSAWHEANYQIARESVVEYKDRAVILRMFSSAAAARFPDEFFDFIYIDAGHEYQAVLRDLHTWWPRLKTGGMFAGDDFADAYDTFPKSSTHTRMNWGVKSAVHNFSMTVGSPFFLTYADFSHHSTSIDPQGGQEFIDIGHASHRLRPSKFYPAWYLFK